MQRRTGARRGDAAARPRRTARPTPSAGRRRRPRHLQPLARAHAPRRTKASSIVERRGGVEHVGEEIPDDLLIHRRPHAEAWPSCRRAPRTGSRASWRGPGDQLAGRRIVDRASRGRSAPRRPSSARRAAGRRDRRRTRSAPTGAGTSRRRRSGTAPSSGCSPGRGEAPRIVDRVDRPAARAVVDARGPRARRAHRLDQPNERLDGLRQVRRLGQPVVHLDVDVGVVVAVPGRLDGVGPEALQVGRQRCRASCRSAGSGRTGRASATQGLRPRRRRNGGGARRSAASRRRRRGRASRGRTAPGDRRRVARAAARKPRPAAALERARRRRARATAPR